MNVVDRPGRPPLSPQEGWISDGRQVLHFKPLRYDRWSQSLEPVAGAEPWGGDACLGAAAAVGAAFRAAVEPQGDHPRRGDQALGREAEGWLAGLFTAVDPPAAIAGLMSSSAHT